MEISTAKNTDTHGWKWDGIGRYGISALPQPTRNRPAISFLRSIYYTGMSQGQYGSQCVPHYFKLSHQRYHAAWFSAENALEIVCRPDSAQTRWEAHSGPPDSLARFGAHPNNWIWRGDPWDRIKGNKRKGEKEGGKGWSRGGATALKVGGQILRAKRAENFFWPPLFGQWGDKILLR